LEVRGWLLVVRGWLLVVRGWVLVVRGWVLVVRGWLISKASKADSLSDVSCIKQAHQPAILAVLLA
jgi:hypothetical protein